MPMTSRRRTALALGLGVGLAASALCVLARNRVRADRRVDEIWRSLEQVSDSGERFWPELVDGLPAPARRYFRHAIAPGTPLASRLRWRYTGALRPGRGMPWLSLRAEQVLARDRGFLWRASARMGPLVLAAVDFYLDGDARMRIALYDLVPIVNASGADVARSARGRLMIEGVALPSALLPGPNVQIEGVDDSRFTVTTRLHGETTTVTLTVDEAGRLQEFVLPRWGDVTDDGSFRYIPYGGTATAERTIGGYTVPTRLAGGWWYGTEQYLEVIRLEVDGIEFA